MVRYLSINLLRGYTFEISDDELANYEKNYREYMWFLQVFNNFDKYITPPIADNWVILNNLCEDLKLLAHQHIKKSSWCTFTYWGYERGGFTFPLPGYAAPSVKLQIKMYTSITDFIDNLCRQIPLQHREYYQNVFPYFFNFLGKNFSTIHYE